jgi:hypothetical protein
VAYRPTAPVRPNRWLTHRFSLPSPSFDLSLISSSQLGSTGKEIKEPKKKQDQKSKISQDPFNPYSENQEKPRNLHTQGARNCRKSPPVASPALGRDRPALRYRPPSPVASPPAGSSLFPTSLTRPVSPPPYPSSASLNLPSTQLCLRNKKRKRREKKETGEGKEMLRGRPTKERKKGKKKKYKLPAT